MFADTVISLHFYLLPKFANGVGELYLGKGMYFEKLLPTRPLLQGALKEVSTLPS